MRVDASIPGGLSDEYPNCYCSEAQIAITLLQMPAAALNEPARVFFQGNATAKDEMLERKISIAHLPALLQKRIAQTAIEIATTMVSPIVNRVENKGTAVVPDKLIQVLPKGEMHNSAFCSRSKSEIY